MDMELATVFFMWCTIFNVVLLMLSSIIFLTAGGGIYKLISRRTTMSRQMFEGFFYGVLGLYKMLIIVFNLIPWLVLELML